MTHSLPFFLYLFVFLQEMAMRKVTRTLFQEDDDDDMVSNH